MRISRRLMILGALVVLIGVLVGSPASSKQSTPLPDSPRWTVLDGDGWFEPGEAFHLFHGYGPEELDGLIGNRFEVHVFMDGIELEPTYVGCTVEEPKRVDCDKIFVWDFPDGLEEGEYKFGVRWIAPCATWIGFAWDDQTVVESCLDDNASMTNLIGDATLMVGDVPEPSLTPVDWTISLDFNGPGDHSIFTVADVRPMTEGAVEDLYGSLTWDGEAVVELCNVSVRDVGDGYIHIGDGYSTSEGCGENPTAMQDAFNAFGLPDTACVGLVTFGHSYQYCAPLEILE